MLIGCVRSLGQCAQGVAQIVGTATGHLLLDCRVGLPPQRISLGEQRAASSGNRQPPAALIVLIDRNFYQATAFEWFEVGGKGRAIHCEQGRDTADTWRFRPIQRRQQRKLAMREIERTEHLIETPRQRAGSPLDVQAQTGVAYLMGSGKR
jgi:hypothetical protein